MSKAKSELPLRFFGTSISLFLLIINILGAVVLFTFGPFFLVRPYESIYFGIFSCVVVISLLVPITSFARPNERYLLHALARRYWAWAVLIAGRGVFMTVEILNIQNTLIAQCQASRRVRQGSAAFFSDLIVNSFSTCSDGMRIFVIVTITALSVDLFLHVTIFICACGLLKIYRNEPEEQETDSVSERSEDSFVKRMPSGAGNSTHRTGAFPSHPQRPMLETYTRNNLQPQMCDPNRRPSIPQASHAAYTFPANPTPVSYQTIQCPERRPSISNPNGLQTGGIVDQRVYAGGPVYGERKQSNPNFPNHAKLISYARQHNMDPQQQIPMTNMCRKNSVGQDAYYSDKGGFASRDSPYTGPLPARSTPFVQPCQVRLMDAPLPMECPTQSVSTAQTGGNSTVPKRNAMTANSASNDLDDSHSETLLDIGNRGVLLVVTNPDLTVESTANETRDDILEGSDWNPQNASSPGRERRPDEDSVQTTQYRDEEHTEKPPSVTEGYTPRSYNENSYRQEDDSEYRFSDSSFERRPYPFANGRRPQSFETEHLSDDRETDPYDRIDNSQKPTDLGTDSRDVHGENVLPESLSAFAPRQPQRFGKEMFCYNDG